MARGWCCCVAGKGLQCFRAAPIFQILEIAPPNEMKVHKKMTVSSRIYAAFWRALIGPKPFYCAITRELPVRSQGMCA